MKYDLVSTLLSDLSSMSMVKTYHYLQISERTISRIPFLAHEMNRHEQDV